MHRLKHSRIALLVAVLLALFVLVFFMFEFWVSPVINSLVAALVDITACQDNHPAVLDSLKCDSQLETYLFFELTFSFAFKFTVLGLLAYYCSKIIIGNKSILGVEYLFVLSFGLASIVVPFTLTSIYGWMSSLLNIFPIYAGCVFFVYRNRKLHNRDL